MKKVEIISNANVHAEEERKMKVEELISLLKNGGSVTVDTAVSKGNLAASTNKSKQVPKINVCAPDTVGDLIKQMRGEGAQQQDDQAHAGEAVANDASNQPEKKSVIPKAVVSADTVGDLINQMRGEGAQQQDDQAHAGEAVANDASNQPEKKSVIPKAVVSADTVGDLINQMRGEGAQQQDDQAHAGEAVANDASNQPEKKAVIPKAVVSADSELDRIRELLSSGNEIEINPDGTLVAAGTNNKSSAAKQKSSASTKAKTIPKAVVSADTVGDLINQMRGESAQQQDDQGHDDEVVTNGTDNTQHNFRRIPVCDDRYINVETINPVENTETNQPEKKSVIPKAVVSASQWYETNKDLYNAEVAAMRKEFNNPNLEPKFMSDGRMYWVVNTTPNLGPGFKTMNYKLLLVYDPDHPKVRYGSSVKVYPVKPTIDELQSIVNRLPGVSPKNIPHTLVDGTGARYLCTADTTNVSADLSKGITSAVTSYRFAYRWLMIFELGIRDPKTWAKFHRHGEI